MMDSFYTKANIKYICAFTTSVCILCDCMYFTCSVTVFLEKEQSFISSKGRSFCLLLLFTCFQCSVVFINCHNCQKPIFVLAVFNWIVTTTVGLVFFHSLYQFGLPFQFLSLLNIQGIPLYPSLLQSLICFVSLPINLYLLKVVFCTYSTGDPGFILYQPFSRICKFVRPMQLYTQLVTP